MREESLHVEVGKEPGEQTEETTEVVDGTNQNKDSTTEKNAQDLQVSLLFAFT